MLELLWHLGCSKVSCYECHKSVSNTFLFSDQPPTAPARAFQEKCHRGRGRHNCFTGSAFDTGLQQRTCPRRFSRDGCHRCFNRVTRHVRSGFGNRFPACLESSIVLNESNCYTCAGSDCLKRRRERVGQSTGDNLCGEAGGHFESYRQDPRHDRQRLEGGQWPGYRPDCRRDEVETARSLSVRCWSPVINCRGKVAPGLFRRYLDGPFPELTFCLPFSPFPLISCCLNAACADVH